MSEAAAVLAGGDGGAGAPPPMNGGEGGGGQVTIPDWAKAFEPDVAEWIGKKGVPDVGALAKSYRQLEQTFGAERAGRAVVLPGEGAKPEEWDQVFKRLGRPDDPKGYGFEAPEGADPALAEKLSGAFHKAGLNPTQAGLVFDAIKELADDTPDLEARAAKNQAEHADLRREWGPGYPQKVALAQRAYRALGVDIDQINAIENVVGTKTMLSMLANLGEALREDAGVGETVAPRGSAQTQETARAKIKELEADTEYMTKVYNGSAAEAAEWQRLHKVAYPS